jgi:hypothetical protein
MSSSFMVGPEFVGWFLASESADVKLLPNNEDPEVFAAGSLSSFADGSGLNELSSLKDPEPNTEPVGLSVLGGNAVLVDESAGAPKGLGLDLFPLPKTLWPLLLAASEAKPPWEANPENPPVEGVAD